MTKDKILEQIAGFRIGRDVSRERMYLALLTVQELAKLALRIDE